LDIYLFELVRIFEAIGAAVGRVLAFEVEVSTSLARSVAVAFNLSALALVASSLLNIIPLVANMGQC
jgi:hypothetical protein